MIFRPYLLEGLALTCVSAGVTMLTTNIFVQLAGGIIGVIGLLVVFKSAINTFNGYIEIA